MQYYVVEAGQQAGPFTIEQLRDRGVRPDTLVWREGMAQWMPAGSVAELGALFAGGVPPVTPPYAMPAGYGTVPPPGAEKKVAAGLCGILVGTFGIHKFILGFTGAGLTMLLITVCTCFMAAPIMHIIGLIEGIIYLTKSDADFYREYIVQKKQWF